LDKFYEKEHPEFPRLRDQVRGLLAKSEDLDQVVQLVGKAALGDSDKITLDVAAMVKDDFLQQNGYSDYDQFCPLWKTEYMMKAFMGYHDEAQKAIAQGQSWPKVRDATSDIQSSLRNMKFEVPDDEAEVSAKVRATTFESFMHSLTCRSMRRFCRPCWSDSPRCLMSNLLLYLKNDAFPLHYFCRELVA
jgi:V-type H+-transporting ATPase subunit A